MLQRRILYDLDGVHMAISVGKRPVLAYDKRNVSRWMYCVGWLSC